MTITNRHKPVSREEQARSLIAQARSILMQAMGTLDTDEEIAGAYSTRNAGGQVSATEPSKPVLDLQAFVASILPSTNIVMFARFEVTYNRALDKWWAYDRLEDETVDRLEVKEPTMYWPLPPMLKALPEVP